MLVTAPAMAGSRVFGMGNQPMPTSAGEFRSREVNLAERGAPSLIKLRADYAAHHAGDTPGRGGRMAAPEIRE